MFDQTMLDALIVVSMFVLRIGLPVAILFGLTAWVEKRLRSPESREAEKRDAGARIIPFARPSAETPRASDQNATREQTSDKKIALLGDALPSASRDFIAN